MIAKMKADGFCCSFCGKSKSEVATLMTGAPQPTPGSPRAFICIECVRRYSQLVAGAGGSRRPETIPHKDLTL